MGRGAPSRTRARRREAGFSLLELLISLSVFGVTMAALSVMQVTSISLSRSNQDMTRAMDAAQSVLEALRDEEDFGQIFARWNADPTDDPAAGCPGNAFDVRGLEPARDDPDGRVGEVVFPGDGFVLSENLTDRSLGTPRDLDLDGEVDADDHADDYRILPVLVRVRWQGARGPEQLQLVGAFAPR